MGRCFKIIGFSPSVPGDFLLWNPWKACLTFSGVTQSGWKAFISSLVIDLLLYSVGLTGVDEGKCCVSRYSSVSVPGSVIVPSVFSSVPSVCLVELSIIFLKVFAASTELIFSL